MTVAHWAPLSTGFSRHEYWTGWPFPPSGIFPTQGSNPRLLRLLYWQDGSSPLVLPRWYIAELIELKMRSLVWALVQQDQGPCEDGKLGHRHAQREDSVRRHEER